MIGESEVTWRTAALRIGEALATSGPNGYYTFTPEQWLAWALAALSSASRSLQEPEKTDDTRVDTMGDGNDSPTASSNVLTRSPLDVACPECGQPRNFHCYDREENGNRSARVIAHSVRFAVAGLP